MGRPNYMEMSTSAVLIVALGAFAIVLLAYAILTAYIIPYEKFIRSYRREEKERKASLEAWRESRGFSKRASGWASDGSTDDLILWFSLPISVVMLIYIFFY